MITYKVKPSRIFTFLQPVKGVVRKTVSTDRKTGGQIWPGAEFRYSQVVIKDLSDMEDVLNQADKYNVCMVPGVLHNPDNLKVIKRRKELKPDCSATFRYCRRRIIHFDFDKIKSPYVASPKDAVADLITELPEPFHSAGYACQLSNSYLTQGSGYAVKCHLFFELNNWYNMVAVQGWAKKHSEVYDPQVYEPNQALYIAPPRFVDGAEEHLEERVWRVDGGLLDLSGLIRAQLERPSKGFFKKMYPEVLPKTKGTSRRKGKGYVQILRSIGNPEVNVPVLRFFMSGLQCGLLEGELSSMAKTQVDLCGGRTYATDRWYQQRMSDAKNFISKG